MRRLLFIVAIAALLAGCGDDAGTSASAASRIGVGLYVPKGWAQSADGLTAAARQADLAAAVPAGPRVRVVQPSGDAEAAGARLADALDDHGNVEVVSEPAQTVIGANPAVAVTLVDQSGVTRRYLAAVSPTGAPVLFILEAPQADYDANAETLAGVPGWVAG